MEENLFLFRRFRLLDQAGKQRVDQQFQEMELTAMQSYVLRYLHDRAGEVVYPKDIEQRFHLTHPTVSGLLARLEVKGFIVCAPDPDDRRCKRVSATEKAEQCLSLIHIFSSPSAASRATAAAWILSTMAQAFPRKCSFSRTSRRRCSPCLLYTSSSSIFSAASSAMPGLPPRR